MEFRAPETTKTCQHIPYICSYKSPYKASPFPESHLFDERNKETAFAPLMYAVGHFLHNLFKQGTPHSVVVHTVSTFIILTQSRHTEGLIYLGLHIALRVGRKSFIV